MPVSPEAKLAKFEGAIINCTIESKILMVFKIFVARLFQNRQRCNNKWKFLSNEYFKTNMTKTDTWPKLVGYE